MLDKPDNPEHSPLPEKVNCAVCHREIPHADAIKDEGEDYILWFCGFDCYQEWQKSGKK